MGNQVRGPKSVKPLKFADIHRDIPRKKSPFVWLKHLKQGLVNVLILNISQLLEI